jgi:hypothetical protein
MQKVTNFMANCMSEDQNYNKYENSVAKKFQLKKVVHKMQIHHTNFKLIL